MSENKLPKTSYQQYRERKGKPSAHEKRIANERSLMDYAIKMLGDSQTLTEQDRLNVTQEGQRLGIVDAETIEAIYYKVDHHPHLTRYTPEEDKANEEMCRYMGINNDGPKVESWQDSLDKAMGVSKWASSTPAPKPDKSDVFASIDAAMKVPATNSGKTSWNFF